MPRSSKKTSELTSWLRDLERLHEYLDYRQAGARILERVIDRIEAAIEAEEHEQ
jgi:hypothetical protein